MKYYEIVYPSNDPVGYDIPIFEILSEQEIIDQYADYCCLMYLSRLGYLPTRGQIIEDWVICHWAIEI